MKRCVCTGLVLLLVLSLLLTFSACGGGLNGTYVSQDAISQTFTFSGDQVTMSAFGIDATGTYRIEGSKIVITYSLFGFEYDWEQSFSQSGNTITIGGTVFQKQ